MSVKKNILIISYYWPPAGGAGVQRWLKLCNYLVELNYHPIVLTVDSQKASYALYDYSLEKELSSKVEVIRTNSFEVLNIYKNFSPKKQIPYAGFTNENKRGLIQKVSKFIRGNFFIPDARIGWNKFALKKAIELIKDRNITTVITTSPPHSTQLIGLELKKIFPIKWIADLRDPWTDIFYYKEFNHTSFAKKMDLNLEKQVLENADDIIVVSENIKHGFQSKTSKRIFNKIHIIPNGFDSKDFEREGLNQTPTLFRMVYTGTISADYPVENLLNAISHLSQNTNFRDTFRLDFYGNASELVKKKFHPFSNLNIHFHAHVSHKESIEKLMEATMLLLIIPNTEKNKGILTGKLFEYLASKKNIIAIGPRDGDASKIIEDCIAGKMFDYQDLGTFKNYFESMFNEFVKNGTVVNNSNSEMVNSFSRFEQAKQLAHIIG